MTPEAAAIRVLLVDDDEAFLSALTAVIADRNIAVVGTAGSGEEALERAEELQPDVIVLDVLMPGIGGVEAARRCRERHPECWLILISGSIFQQQAPDLAELEVDRYLTKSEVMARLQPTILSVSGDTVTHAPR